MKKGQPPTAKLTLGLGLGLTRRLRLLVTHLVRVLPLVDRSLQEWERLAAAIPSPELRRQALASLRTKRFHCEGGAVFATAVPRGVRFPLVAAIVALQTISDYLDNLCDRSTSLNPKDYHLLHQAMVDAVAPTVGVGVPAGLKHSQDRVACDPPPGRPVSTAGAGLHPLQGTIPSRNRGDMGYYHFHPQGQDGGYLTGLVNRCQCLLGRFPGYGRVAPCIMERVLLYNDLQVYKHGPADRRLPQLQAWFARKGGPWHQRLRWWEFAAACGSTLAVFALFREAALNPRPSSERLQALTDAYFPWIGGLHILLDYFIDQAEDRAGGDLNLVSYYQDREELAQRLTLFVREARHQAVRLPDGPLHLLVVDGLLGLYLSDPKVASQGLTDIAHRLLDEAGPGAHLCYAACRAVRTWNRR